MSDPGDRLWREKFRARGPAAPRPGCPDPQALSLTPPDPATLEHLAACSSCREDVVEARRLMGQGGQTERVGAEFRSRVRALLPRKASRAGWFAAAAAAAVLFALALGFGLSQGDTPPPAPVVKRPEQPKVIPPVPKPEPVPAPTAPPKPELPAPPPKPPEPAPEKPAPPRVEPPRPETPVIAKPVDPPKPVPPEKPAPVEPTRAKRRGSLLALAGSCAAQGEGEAAGQAVRAGQAREFAGTVRLRADVADAKVRIEPHTVFLDRGAECLVSLEEGGTVVRLDKGEAFFDAAPKSGDFTVETAAGRIGVKATRFLVSAQKAETEVLVQRGAVDFAGVKVSAGERSAAAPGKAPSAAAATDVSKRLAWVRALEEIFRVEAEQLALQQGMTLLPDPGASGGRAIGLKGHPAAGQEPAGEIRVKRKQRAPYFVWMRVHWGHNVPSNVWYQVNDTAKVAVKDLPMNAAWQWYRAGSFEVAEETFRFRLGDAQGGARIDQILFTTDPEHTPSK